MTWGESVNHVHSIIFEIVCKEIRYVWDSEFLKKFSNFYTPYIVK